VLLAAPPILAPAKLAQRIKGESSDIPISASGIPGTAQTLLGAAHGARRYFCATVGAVDEATIKAYIENQKWDEDEEGFKITTPNEP
jgi:REP element-mobilizing transposase RayT